MSYNQNGGSQAPARVKTFLDSDVMVMRAPSTEPKKYANLTFSVYKNNPRIRVYTNDANDQQYKNGLIEAAMDPVTFTAFIDEVRKAIEFQPTEQAPEYKFALECKNYVFTAGKKSDEALLQATIIVGKNPEGRVYLSLLPYKKERPRIQFFFGMPADKWNGTTFHTLLKGDKTPYTMAEVSCCYAKAFLKLLQESIFSQMVAAWVDIPRNKEGDGNKGGGNGGWNKQGGGNNKPAPEAEENEDYSQW